jgi:hypothetical protein
VVDSIEDGMDEGWARIFHIDSDMEGDMTNLQVMQLLNGIRKGQKDRAENKPFKGMSTETVSIHYIQGYAAGYYDKK